MQHIQDAFHAHERQLWSVCYQMTGSAADADDLVQDTFERLMSKPPTDLNAPLRPWLMTVAMNLSRDRLRARKRRSYPGTWLPAPAPLEALGESGGARYERAESVTYAFLLALEVLTAKQRAVLVLRDVLGYSVREAAETLGMSRSNVKTTHHRARKAMSGYDAARCRPSAELSARTREALQRFTAALLSGSVGELEAMMREDVVALSDGGGVYAAAREPIVGRPRVIHLYQGLARLHASAGITWLELNGLPALLIHSNCARPQFAPRSITRVELGPAGRVAAIHAILAPRKLAAIERPSA